ncbi:MAG: hypothetical protein ACLQME_00075 [Alphaproteobacteria bacterium]
MRALDMNIFVGTRAFLLALLYFYVLNLSIIVMFWGVLPNWLVVGGWALLFAALLGEEYTERKNGRNNFVGVEIFAIATLYFYVLGLSIVVTYWGLFPAWLVVAGWVLLVAELYGEKYVRSKIGRSPRPAA